MERSDIVVLDEINQCLATKNKKIKLTKTETKLLIYLIKNKNKVCSYVNLIQLVYNASEETVYLYRDSLTTIISKLRRKLKNENLEIKSVYNYGIFINYIIDEKRKKEFNKILINQKIEKLKDEIQIKNNQIKKLEESIK